MQALCSSIIHYIGTLYTCTLNQGPRYKNKSLCEISKESLKNQSLISSKDVASLAYLKSITTSIDWFIYLICWLTPYTGLLHSEYHCAALARSRPRSRKILCGMKNKTDYFNAFAVPKKKKTNRWTAYTHPQLRAYLLLLNHILYLHASRCTVLR